MIRPVGVLVQIVDLQCEPIFDLSVWTNRLRVTGLISRRQVSIFRRPVDETDAARGFDDASVAILRRRAPCSRCVRNKGAVSVIITLNDEA